MSHSSVMPMRLEGIDTYVYCADGGVVGVAADGDDAGRILWQTSLWSPKVCVPSPVVFDDISALLTDNNFLDMLKSLCETGKKSIRWGTTTSKLDVRAKSFNCTSPVLIVLNKIPDKNPDVRAILDRCDTIRFNPTKVEIIKRMREIAPNDSHLIDLIAELPVLPTLRTLVKARQWAQSQHLDLLEELFAECGVPEPVSVLITIMQNHPEAQWCRRYVETTGLTDRTFRRHRAIATELLACRESV